MHALVSGKARIGARTLLARAGGVFMWPGIALTERRGAACVPIAADVARFWISRLHGPEANDWAVLRCLGIAAHKLTECDEAGAQQALDASGLTRLSSDGAVLARVVAGSLGIAPLDPPWTEGPRLWRAEDIAAHLPLFKDYAPAAGLLAKAGLGTSRRTPRVPAGSREGGQFQSTGAGGSFTEKPPEIPPAAPPTEQLRNAFAKLAARWLARALAGAAFGPEGEFVVALDAAAETALWLYDKYPLIKAYLDEPKSLEELQNNVGKPEKGYDVHHIVEQTPARDDKIQEDLIEGPDNLVSIPRLNIGNLRGGS